MVATSQEQYSVGEEDEAGFEGAELDAKPSNIVI